MPSWVSPAGPYQLRCTSLQIATEMRPVRNTSHLEWHGRPRPSHARPTFRSLFEATEHNYSACRTLWSTHIFFRYSWALLPDYALGKPCMASSAAAYTARPGDVLELHSRPEEEWRQDGHRTCNCKFWLSERPANRRLHYTALRRRLPPGTGFRRYRSSIWKSTAPVCETFADWPALKAASLK
jgi:hypothetical protein